MKGQTDIKEYDFGTLWNLLMITSNEISYPQEAPPNTSDKTPPQGFKKYGTYDLRNYTDNQGWIPIKIDYKNFKPKKYYKDVDQQTLEKHLQALQKKEDLLKHFKHYEDFDRIDYSKSNKSNTYENHLQKVIFSHAATSLIISRILMIQVHNHKFSYTLWRNVFKRVYFYTLPFCIISTVFYQVVNPVNHEYFRSPPKSVRIYEHLAYDTDAFQYNNDLKYNFKYPEHQDYENTLESVYAKKRDAQYQDALRYYKKMYGIVDPEPFWNKEKKNESKQAV